MDNLTKIMVTLLFVTLLTFQKVLVLTCLVIVLQLHILPHFFKINFTVEISAIICTRINGNIFSTFRKKANYRWPRFTSKST